MELSKWYWRNDDNDFGGPVKISAIVEAAVNGAVSPSTQVFHEVHTKGDWIPATRIEPLRIILREPVPVGDERASLLVQIALKALLKQPEDELTEGSTVPLSHDQSSRPVQKKQLGPLLLESDFVDFDESGEVDIRANDPRELKLAIKALKGLKKHFALEVRKVNSEMKLIRSNYTAKVMHRGSMMRGGGDVGTFVRTIQGISRDVQRSQLATSLQPHDEKKRYFEGIVHRIDTVILSMESAV